MPTDVMVFTDYACPWCYLGRARLGAALAERDAQAIVVHFPLAADTPHEGRLVFPHLRARGIDPDAATARLVGQLEAAGLPYADHPELQRAYNTRLAQELAVWAERQEGGSAIHDALFHAYHVDNVNLHDVEVLVRVAGEVGLDADEARAVVTERRFERPVDAHWALASRLGVRSVPTFVANGRGLVGAQPVDAITRLIDTPAA